MFALMVRMWWRHGLDRRLWHGRERRNKKEKQKLRKKEIKKKMKFLIFQ